MLEKIVAIKRNGMIGVVISISMEDIKTLTESHPSGGFLVTNDDMFLDLFVKELKNDSGTHTGLTLIEEAIDTVLEKCAESGDDSIDLIEEE